MGISLFQVAGLCQVYRDRHGVLEQAEEQRPTAEALVTLDEALAQVERAGERWFEAELYRRKGVVLMARVPSPAGEDYLQRALVIARRQTARLWELRPATDLARLWQTQGRLREAHALLEPVHAWFTEGFGTPDLQEAKALLDELASGAASSPGMPRCSARP